jgi:hypothetical protein
MSDMEVRTAGRKAGGRWLVARAAAVVEATCWLGVILSVVILSVVI